MKTIIALLSALLLLSAAACTSVPEPVPTESEIATEAPTEAPDGEDIEVLLRNLFGSEDAQTYYHDYYRFYCELPEGWNLHGYLDVLAENGFSADEPLTDQIRQMPMFLIMSADHPDTRSTATILLDMTSEASAAEYIASQVESTRSTMEQAGFANVTAAETTCHLLGEDRPCLELHYELDGEPVCHKMIAVEAYEGILLFSMAGSEELFPAVLDGYHFLQAN